MRLSEKLMSGGLGAMLLASLSTWAQAKAPEPSPTPTPTKTTVSQSGTATQSATTAQPTSGQVKAESKAQQAQPSLSLPVEQYTLPNGLTVMLSENHEVPSVAVHLVYLVGSGHEKPGKTGFAHLFEHLMFQGSEHYNADYFTPYEPIGAQVNGNTNADRTVYYEVVPSQYRELPLWMESDRMRSLLPALDQQKLDNQREVVKNERRQRYEITPYGMSYWHLDNALYPESHPYHHSTIGSHEDLSAASLKDVSEFFEQYYVPANTGLVIAGNFDSAEMKALIEKYFGDIPAGERASTPTAALPPLESKHWVAEDTIQLPRVYFAWISPALFEQGDAELDLLSNVLTQGKSSRLYQKLVYQDQIAKDIYAYQMSEKLNGVYVIQATAAPGKSLDDLAKAIESTLAQALSSPISPAEMERAKNDYKKGFYHRLEDYESRSSLIGTYFLHTGKGDYLQADFDRYETATAEAVLSAGKKYLDFNHVVRLDFVPGSKSTPVKKMPLKAQAPNTTTATTADQKAEEKK